MTTFVLRTRDGEVSSGSTGLSVTDDNYNPVVQVLTWLFLALFTLALGFRCLSIFYLKSNRLLRWDNTLMLLAYVTAVGQSVTFVVPGSSIFGSDKELRSATEDDLRVGMKIQYAGDLLFILALGFAKLSVCASLFEFSPNRTHRRINSVLIIIIIFWILSSELGTAFQCGSRHPWEQGRASCINLHAFLSYVEIANIITDVALVLIPIAIISPLQMPITTRAIIISLFGSRILVIVSTIFQLIYLPHFLENPFTVAAAPYYISTQATLFASITAACTAYFWPLFRSIRSGLVSANITTFSSSYALSRVPKLQRGNKVTTDKRGAPWEDTQSYVKITTDTTVNSTSSRQETVDEISFQRERYIDSWNASQ
ncbi:hypothetical protein F4859DRAFT_490137 [Xylaria cf. heliscus]|nr:hypothetical protein F4859DRAFT_490137 [Xylaria cf. heliscus]